MDGTLKKLLTFLAFVAVVGFAGYSFKAVSSAGGSGPDPATLFPARRGELAIVVTENGYLKARKSVKMKPEFRGEGLITWLIDEGTVVEEGEKLVEFEKKEIQTQTADLQSQITESEVKLEAAMATLEIERSEADGVIEKAELQLQIAQLELERYEQGELPNELRKLRLAEDKADSEWNRAAEKFKLIPALAEEGFFTPAEVEEEEIKVREAKLAAETAKLDLELYEEYSQKIEFKQKNAALRDATRGLANARKKTQISMREKEANIARQKGQLEASRNRLEKLMEDMEKMTMKAPQAGIVHYGDAGSPWSRDRIKIGNRVYRGSTIITLPDLSEMEVLTKIHEADIDKVKPDQEVTITLDTYPGLVFTGKVTRIASVATSSGWDENTKAFRITITMDPSEVELRAGISAKVEIEVTRLEDVLTVPIHSVFAEEGEHFCFVANGVVRKRTVTVGQNNAHFVVILDGLEEGEKVLLYDPRDREAPEDSASTALEAEDSAVGGTPGTVAE